MRSNYRVYDFRLKQLIIESENPDLFPSLKIPISTARGWIRHGISDVVTLPSLEMTDQNLLDLVSVNYLPQHQSMSSHLTEILRQIEGVEKIICTMSTTNLLWIQEQYDAKDEVFDDILDIATRRDSAIELMQLSESEDAMIGIDESSAPKSPSTSIFDPVSDHGGILDDVEPADDLYDESVRETMERLVASGRSGGYQRVLGNAKNVLQDMDRSVPYSLVVVGNVFMSKPSSVRKRFSQELVNALSENLKVPVILVDELKSRYQFGRKQLGQLIMYGAMVTLMVGLVFSFQKEVLEFTSQEGSLHRIFSTICIFGLVPLFAYCYGGFTGHVLRFLKFE